MLMDIMDDWATQLLQIVSHLIKIQIKIVTTFWICGRRWNFLDLWATMELFGFVGDDGTLAPNPQIIEHVGTDELPW